MVVLEVAGCKQLVLTDIRHQYGVVLRLLGNGVYHLAHQQRPLLRMDGRFNDLRAFLLVEFLERRAPLRVRVLIQ